MVEIWQKMRKEKLVFVLLVLIQFFANTAALNAEPEEQVICMAASGALFLILSVYVACLQRKNMLCFVLSIAILYFNYSLVAGVYWSADSLPRIFDSHSYDELLRGMNLVLVFFTTFLCCLKANREADIHVFLEKYPCSWLIVLASAVYISAAPFLFYNTESFGTRGIASAFYEYSLVILIVALAFCGRNLKALSILMLASGWIILHGLLHGERALALQMLIICGVYLMLHRFSLKLIIPGCIAGIFVFTLFGLYRGLNDLEGDVLTQVFRFLKNGGMANDTSFAAFQTSLNVVRFADMSSLSERLTLFLRYLLYIVAGGAVKDVNLARLALEAGVHGGGGWLPGYFYFWLGYPGVILSAAALGWFVNRISRLSKENKFQNYLSLYVLATVPRWYLYSPSALTRGLLLYILVFAAAQFVHRYSGQAYRLCVEKLEKWRKK